jgi:1-acyl-sn-glycerol-3-phosphate acyltransferase
MRSLATRPTRLALTGLARLVTGVSPRWQGCGPSSEQRIYFANHASHGDFVLIWTVLPPELRATTRPVAGGDYWRRGAVRRFVGNDVFKAVLIERSETTAARDVLDPVKAALGEGASLIIFPEGTRNQTEAPLLPFKSGIYHIARAFPSIPLVPVWIENVGRVMPKGELLPVPLLCSVTFGSPTRLQDGERRPAFLERCEAALKATAPGAEASHGV